MHGHPRSHAHRRGLPRRTDGPPPARHGARGRGRGGAFVETKNAHLGADVLARHLAYLGDVTVGPGTNVGCGTITANSDGRRKHHTQVGAGAFLGAGTILVAPTSVGDKATTGAGSVVTKSHPVPPGETLALR